MKLVVLISIYLVSLGAHASEIPENKLREIRFDQKINAQIPLGAQFRDETGTVVRLSDYFGRKPVVLVLAYYGCPMLCTLVSNGLIETFHDLKSDIGNQFDVLHVSIAPTETPPLAAAKKREYLRRYGRPGAGAGWHFLTGDEASIRQLADAVGYRYAYDPESKQYAHPSGFVVLTPQGRVSRYFFGVDFRARELNDALHAADPPIRSARPSGSYFSFAFTTARSAENTARSSLTASAELASPRCWRSRYSLPAHCGMSRS